MTATYTLTPHESVTLRSETPEAIEVEALYAPGGDPPPAHLHPAQDERFEVLAGELRTKVAGRERPAPDKLRGRGLWLVNQLCDLVEVRSQDGGNVVRFRLAV